ncbi:hypothetical protein PTKIN_Ptkin16aG0507300 [Pterospermum kingtungense]
MITGCSWSGDVNKVYAAFTEMPLRDIASWSATIGEFTNSRKWSSGFACFREMVAEVQI